jgi:hypothetical protein
MAYRCLALNGAEKRQGQLAPYNSIEGEGEGEGECGLCICTLFVGPQVPPVKLDSTLLYFDDFTSIFVCSLIFRIMYRCAWNVLRGKTELLVCARCCNGSPLPGHVVMVGLAEERASDILLCGWGFRLLRVSHFDSRWAFVVLK